MKLGRFKGVDELSVQGFPRRTVTTYNFYSMVHAPRPPAGCANVSAPPIAAMQQCHDRKPGYTGETPCGMKFTTLAGVMGGGASSPGFVGHSKFNITQRKLSWVTAVCFCAWCGCPDAERGTAGTPDQAAQKWACPDLIDRIADETVGITEEILPLPAGKRNIRP
ncbi:MAG: hypothetical protein R2941_01260 [Desulfobacterales bacterium]